MSIATTLDTATNLITYVVTGDMTLDQVRVAVDEAVSDPHQVTLLRDRDARGVQEEVLELGVERVVTLPATTEQEIRQPHQTPPRTRP